MRDGLLREAPLIKKGVTIAMNRTLSWGIVFIFSALVGALGYWGLSRLMAEPDPTVRIPAETVADYVHAVIDANRTVYTTHVVDKMQEKNIVPALEHWKQEAALPLPAQFLIETGKLIGERGIGIKYRLASLTPIYVWNAPTSDFERKGLEVVIKNPNQPFTGFIREGGKRFFKAVYADTAISHTCVDCHNSHTNSPRRDYKLHDVMGGIIITIPVGK